jgi:GNAT superfamily N-acetyltransferase
VTSLRDYLDGALVVTRCDDLTKVPPARLPDDFRIAEMDMQDPADVDAWLKVHNDSFGHSWRPENFEGAILKHPKIRVDHTFFVLRGDEPVGAASVGVYRGNEATGVGHYLGVKKEAQSSGVGRQLVAHRYVALAESGITSCESQTHISRRPSLWIHFGFGFRPKYRLDTWNNPENVVPPVRLLTNARLWAFYRRWRSSRRP